MCANVDKLPAMETSYLCDLVDASKTESLELLKLLLLFEPLLLQQRLKQQTAVAV